MMTLLEKGHRRQRTYVNVCLFWNRNFYGYSLSPAE